VNEIGTIGAIVNEPLQFDSGVTLTDHEALDPSKDNDGSDFLEGTKDSEEKEEALDEEVAVHPESLEALVASDCSEGSDHSEANEDPEEMEELAVEKSEENVEVIQRTIKFRNFSKSSRPLQNYIKTYGGPRKKSEPDVRTLNVGEVVKLLKEMTEGDQKKFVWSGKVNDAQIRLDWGKPKKKIQFLNAGLDSVLYVGKQFPIEGDLKVIPVPNRDNTVKVGTGLAVYVDKKLTDIGEIPNLEIITSCVTQFRVSLFLPAIMRKVNGRPVNFVPKDTMKKITEEALIPSIRSVIPEGQYAHYPKSYDNSMESNRDIGTGKFTFPSYYVPEEMEEDFITELTERLNCIPECYGFFWYMTGKDLKLLFPNMVGKDPIVRK
jgi:hypothetical protein